MSEYELTDKCAGLFNKLGPEIRRFYHRVGYRLTNAALALEIERKWGEEIVRDICIPHNLTRGECLVMAVHAATNEEVIP